MYALHSSLTIKREYLRSVVDAAAVEVLARRLAETQALRAALERASASEAMVQRVKSWGRRDSSARSSTMGAPALDSSSTPPPQQQGSNSGTSGGREEPPAGVTVAARPLWDAGGAVDQLTSLDPTDAVASAPAILRLQRRTARLRAQAAHVELILEALRQRLEARRREDRRALLTALLAAAAEEERAGPRAAEGLASALAALATALEDLQVGVHELVAGVLGSFLLPAPFPFQWSSLLPAPFPFQWPSLLPAPFPCQWPSLLTAPSPFC